MNSPHTGQIDETIRRAFESAWCAGRPPAIRDLLPDAARENYLATLEELVMIDVEFRWKTQWGYASQIGDVTTNPPTPIEDYLTEFPALDEPEIIRRLVQEEIHVRTMLGSEQTIDIDDYRRRFPNVEVHRLTAADRSRNQGTSPGQILGRYQVLELHARGGCGEVWRAFDRVLERVVALKTIHRKFVRDQQVRRRFEEEARTTARLEHPGIVSVHDLNEDGATPYYAMRFLGGTTLAEAIGEYHDSWISTADKAVARMRLLSAFLAICRAVEFAHSKGVVHRDLKPQNIVLGDYGEISILDWGLAKRGPDDTAGPATRPSVDANELPAPARSPAPPASGSLGTTAGPFATREGTVVGTPAYMSPEQAQGDVASVDHLSDQFCVGSILYQILTGQPPQYAGNVADATRRHLLAPQHLEKRTPAALNAICMKAMSWSREERYDSMNQLIADFERFLSDEPVTAFAEPWTTRASRWIKRHKTMMIAAVTGLVIATVVSAIAVALLVDVNRDLAARKKESEFLRERTEEALGEATRNLYAHSVGMAHAELMKNNVGRAKALLAECPETLRNWEWRYLASVIQQQSPSIILREHVKSVRCITFSPSGKILATSGSDGRVVLRRADNLKVIQRFEYGGEVRAVAFREDEQQLWVGGLVPSDKLVGKLVIWSLVDGQQLHEQATGGRAVMSMVVDRRNESVVTAGDDGKIVTWDANTFQPLHELQDRDATIRNLALWGSSDGQQVRLATCGDDGRVNLWNWISRERTARLIGHGPRSARCVFDQTGAQLISCGHDDLLKIWSVQETERHSRATPTADDAVAAGASERQVDTEPPAADRVFTVCNSLLGHTDKVECVAIDGKGRLLASGGYDRTIRIWDLRTRQLVTVIRHHTSHVRALAFSPDGRRLFSGGDEAKVNVWNMDELVLDLPSGMFVAFSPDRNQLAVANKRRLVLRDLDDGTVLRTDLSEFAEICGVDFSPTGNIVACCSRSQDVVLIDATDGVVTRQLDSDHQAVFEIRFSPDGQRIAAGCADNHIRIWDVNTGSRVNAFDLGSFALRLAFSENGERLIAGLMRGEIGWWDVNSGQCIRRQSAHQRNLLSLAVHYERKLLATTGGDGMIRLWRLDTGEPLQTMDVGASWLNCLTFTRSGERLISGSEQTVTFWEPTTGREITSMTLDRCVHNMSLNLPGDLLALAGESPQIRIWPARRDPPGWDRADQGDAAREIAP